jgi:hypothetical protein
VSPLITLYPKAGSSRFGRPGRVEPIDAICVRRAVVEGVRVALKVPGEQHGAEDPTPGALRAFKPEDGLGAESGGPRWAGRGHAALAGYWVGPVGHRLRSTAARRPDGRGHDRRHIDAARSAVWRWLVDGIWTRRLVWLRLAGQPGAQGERILAHYQRLHPGDGLRNCRTDDASPQGYDVRTVFPPRALVIVRARNLRSRVNATHDLGWRPDSYLSVSRAPAARGRASRRCRLILRTRMESAPAWLRSLVRLVVPAEPLMQRRRLVEIRPRAESRAAAEADGSARAAGRGARARRFLPGSPRPAAGRGR